MARSCRPTVVSLFTGAGGLDIGLEWAGFQTAAAVECDTDCVETLRINQRNRISVPGEANRALLAGTRIVPKRIEDVGIDDLRPEGGGARWVPDLVAGGPPCQPFSSSGKLESVNDPRGRLFEEFVRVTTSLKPRFVLFENVRGLVTARGPRNEPGEALLMVREAFERAGYATRFALLNAADYGSPQRRVRCFMIGCRTAPLPTFPDPTHTEAPVESLFGVLPAWVTLGEFLRGRSEPEPEDIVRPTPALAGHLADMPNGCGLRSAGARETTRPGGHWGYRQGTFIADPALPARTVTASASQDWIRLRDGSLRRLTWRECAALQGFPPGWTFAGGAASRFRQIGNAVPVIFGRVIGVELARALLQPQPANGKVESAPLPSEFTEAIAYTKREHDRNGGSRAMTLRLQKHGNVPWDDIKGLGSEGRRRA